MLKGIDSQVLIHRITDYAKESSSIVRRDELAQSQFSSAFREQVQDQRRQVQDTNKSEHQNSVTRDKQGGNKQERENSKKKDNQSAERALSAEGLLEVGQPKDAIGRRLDIMA